MSKHHHKVKTHRWIDGKLHTAEYLFESFEDALGFSRKNNNDVIKIYNPEGQIVHQVGATPTDTYA